ncbi:MAG: DUF6457 domain-containing protein [Microbacteriaceae bacterium]
MSTPSRIPPETLNSWLSSAAHELELEENVIPIALILNVAADIAHGVARPAAPLSTFLLGLALGQKSRGEASLEELSADLSRLAKGWDSPVAETRTD